MIDSHEFIFAKQLLDRFRAHNLLFVYQETELTGVVHFSDYNRPSVNAYLFNLLSAYERSLRKVLSLSGLNNRDMLNYFTKMIVSSDNKLIKHVYSEKLRGFEKNKARYEKLHDFDRFPLKDLIDLAKHHHIICLSEKVIDLRNMVMHAQELVNIEDAGREDFIYDFSSFEKFFIQVDILLHDYKKANNLISFKELERA